ISLLDEKGRPTPVERAFVLPPASRIGPITAEERKAIISGSAVAGVYEKVVDRESAYEKLKGRAATATPTGTPSAAPGAPAAAEPGVLDSIKDVMFGTTGPRGGKHEGLAESMARSAVRTIGSSVGREII